MLVGASDALSLGLSQELLGGKLGSNSSLQLVGAVVLHRQGVGSLDSVLVTELLHLTLNLIAQWALGVHLVDAVAPASTAHFVLVAGALHGATLGVLAVLTGLLPVVGAEALASVLGGEVLVASAHVCAQSSGHATVSVGLVHGQVAVALILVAAYVGEGSGGVRRRSKES